MAKDKKSPKQATDLFENIIKASVNNNPMKKEYTSDQRQEALMKQLKGHPALSRLVREVKPTRHSGQFSSIDINEINNGVALLATYWNLSGGSVGDFDLYELLQTYLRNPNAREKINEIVKGSYK